MTFTTASENSSGTTIRQASSRWFFAEGSRGLAVLER
jgi:hypothetical protein